MFPRPERLFTSILPFLPCTNLDPCSAFRRLLIAGTGFSNLEQIRSLLRFTKDLLLTSSYLSDRIFTGEHIKFLASQYLNVTNNHWCSWSVSTVVGGGRGREGRRETGAVALGLIGMSFPAVVSGGAPDVLRAQAPPPTLPAAVLHPARDPGFQLRG